MVLLLVLVSSILIAMMLDRQSGQNLIVEKQLDAYQAHHVGRGFREAIEAWLTTNKTSGLLSDSLDADGHAFDLVVDSGRTGGAAGGSGQGVRVSMFDAQGAILIDLTGLSAQGRELGQAIIERFRQDFARERPERIAAMIRREGPLAISASSAPPEILRVVADAVMVGTEGAASGKGDDLMKEILRAREAGALDTTALNDVFTRANLPPDARTRASLAFVPQASLWRIEAEVVKRRTQQDDEPPVRYGGLAMVRSAQAGNVGALGALGGAPQSRTAMISWDRLPADPRGTVRGPR